ncbi:glycosyltransferase [Hymenobacter coccineus]|uniref:Streptomycin biosynthesis protein StrF domain-containing protein n=1 Tax=Hymenobacter coccineus TaxID=1908235 RepID=A0A1G1TJN7_9BACT|nr:glycosyltransferase [Hymenobacter coccineus]OGX91080.1 hypothetical protein BEN49_05410 [Hymenobacter coccineus]
MISIIICSRDSETLRNVSLNVEQTIGVAHEVVAIDNSRGEYGICQAYNLGAKRSKYDVLCFMHEDLCFHTPNWGGKVAEILSDRSIGVLGVAGGMYQLRAPVPWWFMGTAYMREQVLHSVPGEASTLHFVNPQEQSLADVAVVDGLWLCSTKAVWEQHPFDEKTFPAFHFYDMDYCTSIFPHYRVCVTFDILIEHYSKGSINEAWLANALNYQRKWKQQLPFGVIKIAKEQNAELERRGILDFIDKFIPSKIPSGKIVSSFAQLLSIAPLSRESLGMVRRFVRLRLLR